MWQLGYPEQALKTNHEALTLAHDLSHPFTLAMALTWAEAYGKRGQAEAGLRAVEEALAFVERTEERFYEAELRRLQGEFLLQQSPDQPSDAAACFQHALDVSRSQEAKSLELRAAMSLARLWQSQGRKHEAHDLLAPVYDWFTEGFDTQDLKDAKALLTALT